MKTLHKLVLGIVMTLTIGGFSFLTELQIFSKTMKIEVNHDQNPQLTKFLKYCARFHKNYLKKDKFDDKLEKFKQTMDLIDLENNNSSNTFELGITELSDLSDKEFVQMSSGLNDVYYQNLPTIQIDQQEFFNESQKEEFKEFVDKMDNYDFSQVKIQKDSKNKEIAS